MRNQPTFRAADRKSLHEAAPSAAAAKLALVVVASPVEAAVGRVVEVGDAPVVLGRVGDATTEDDWMSREHATVRRASGRLHVVDGVVAPGGSERRPSANGTFVVDVGGEDDEVEVHDATPVEVGHVVRTGRTLWMVVERAAPPPPGSLLAGVSDAMGRVRDELALVVAEVALRLERERRVTQALLVTGARGTGKQVVAREAHRLLAARRGGNPPFIEVPAPALADGTSGADIFGVVDKYATDVKGRPGYFERAHHGVLLIDEVADLPLAEQAKLLGLLEERHVTRLGGRQPFAFDCLVVAATNRDIDAAVAAGTFRADLLDRLGRFRVHLPSLAERPEDVLPVATALLARHGHAASLPWGVAIGVARRAWDGNVRELDAFIERLIAYARHGSGIIDLAVSERATRGLTPSRAADRATTPPSSPTATSAEVGSVEGRGQAPPRDELLRQLEQHGWNKTEVGRHYGKHPRQITRWMAYLGIERPA